MRYKFETTAAQYDIKEFKMIRNNLNSNDHDLQVLRIN